METGEAFAMRQRVNNFKCAKKREYKFSMKEEQKSTGQGIDVTNLLESKKHPYRHLIFNQTGQKTYGKLCRFVSKDKGVSYSCESCSSIIKAEGRSKQSKVLFVWLNFSIFNNMFKFNKFSVNKFAKLVKF